MYVITDVYLLLINTAKHLQEDQFGGITKYFLSPIFLLPTIHDEQFVTGTDQDTPQSLYE